MNIEGFKRFSPSGHRARRHPGLYPAILVLICALFLPISLSACSGKNPETTDAIKYFPTQNERADTYPLSLGQGKLVIFDSSFYLERVFPDQISRRLIIWPPGFSYQFEDEKAVILDNNKQTVTREGENIKLGGGEIPAEMVNQLASPVLPEDKPGPYFMVSKVIND